MMPWNQARSSLPFATSAEGEYEGLHGVLDPVLEMLEEATGSVRSTSMDVTNDPRFFHDNVLNKRLQSFSRLSVLAGLMVGFSSKVTDLRTEDMNLQTYDGKLQFASFVIMSLVLFANVVATYVGVAQVYHVNRLETAGPTGFEMATTYYLNRNIVAWRHLAVKSMLQSLPLYLAAIAIRVQVTYDEAVESLPHPSWWAAHSMGFLSMVVYICIGVSVWCIHLKHDGVFKDEYSSAMAREMPHLSHVQGLMTSHSQRKRGTLDLDV